LGDGGGVSISKEEMKGGFILWETGLEVNNSTMIMRMVISTVANALLAKKENRESTTDWEIQSRGRGRGRREDVQQNR
jgi:hypothetical protein